MLQCGVSCVILPRSDLVRSDKWLTYLCKTRLALAARSNYLKRRKQIVASVICESVKK